VNLKGTQTEKNLLIAFAGESQARNRYTYYASESRKAGFEYIAAIFLETADNEREHAKVFFKHLTAGGGEMTEIAAGYPYHLGDTLTNLESAAAGENYEWTTMYQNFA
jgi:rubrerythrin